MTYRCVGTKNQRQPSQRQVSILSQNTKKYSRFKQNSIAVGPPYVNYEVPYSSFLIPGIYFTMLILYSIKQMDDSEKQIVKDMESSRP